MILLECLWYLITLSVYKYPSYITLNNSLNGMRWAYFINLSYIIYIISYSIPVTESFNFNNLTIKSIVTVCQDCFDILII